jgi:ribosomal protein S18 acetylase RimI-like enzyme
VGGAIVGIRPYQPDDIDRIISLANAYAYFDAGVTNADFAPAVSFPDGLIVAEEDGNIVGFVFGYPRDVPEEVLQNWNATKAGQVELIVVDPRYRQRNLGETLLTGLLEVFRSSDVDVVLLHCPVEAEAARHMYDKLGFDVRAYAMWKRL